MKQAGEVERLDALAARINAEHRACGRAMNAALAHALVAGALLIEAKKEVKHGGWELWLAGNFEGAERTAQNYMYLARNRRYIEEAKAQGYADLSISRALKIVPTYQREPDPLVIPTPGQEAARRRRERERQRLLARAELAIRTGNQECPVDVEIENWQQALWRAQTLREQNIPLVLDALAYEFDILVHHARPEDVSEYLAGPVKDFYGLWLGSDDASSLSSSLIEELRTGIAWLTRLLEELERHTPPGE